MSGFLPPVVMTIIADAKKFIDEQGKVITAADESSKKVIDAAEKAATAAEATAKREAAAAAAKADAAQKAADEAALAAARTVEAEDQLARTTEEDRAKATAAVEIAAQKQVEAQARADAALLTSQHAQDDATKAAETAAAKRAAADEAAASKSSGHWAGAGKVAAGTAMVMGGASLAAGAAAVDMAVHFQTSTTKLVTSGGESEDAINSVRDGILRMSGDVGVSADQLATAMYMVESAGYHGAAGLGLLEAAEQGAKAEGADGAKVADALSSALRDYYPHATSAADVTKASTDVMSKFIGATSAGKMTFDDLAGSLNSILPVSSAAKISLSDTMGVLASMTVHGISADQATQNMADAIRHLQAPTAVMSKAMATLGVDSTDVAQKLGERGLSGTMQFLSEKVKAAMPPGTEKVVLDLGNALSKSSPQVQELGQKLMDGSITMKEFGQAARELDPISGGQAMQFETLAKSTHQIGNQMLSGADVLQTYGGTMAKVMGDATGLKVALMTTGENAQYTSDAIKSVSGSTADASGNVKGWADVQKNAGQSMAELKASVGALGIEIGTALLPIVKAAADGLKGFVDWANSNPAMFQAIAIGIMAVSVAFGVAAVAFAVFNAVASPEIAVIAGVILVIVALGLAVAWLVTHWSDVVSFLTTVWGGFMGWVRGVIDGFVSWWLTVWDPFAAFFKGVWDGIVNAAKIAVALIFTLVVGPIVAYANIMGAIFKWLYENAIKPVWDAISKVIGDAWTWIYTNVVKPVIDYLNLLGLGFRILYETYVKPVWDAISKAIGDAWTWIYTNVVQAIQLEVKGLGIVFNWLHDNVIQPVWDGIRTAIGNAWNWISSNVFDPIGRAIDLMGKGFQAAQKIIGDAWDKIRDAAKAPVQFIVDQVYNQGIRAVWNNVSDAVGLHMDLPAMQFASGGTVPGYAPGQDIVHALLSPGEGILVPQAVRALGGAAGIDSINRQFGHGGGPSVKGGTQAFGDGGIVGDILGSIGNAVGGALGALKDVVAGGVQAAATPIVHGIEDLARGTLGSTGIGGMLDKGVNTLGDDFLNFLGGKDKAATAAKAATAGSIGAPGAVSGNLPAWVQAAMAAASVAGGDWLNGLETIAMHESGGNPNATNNWDSNAAAGDPSRGIMQTIGSTFEAYRMSSLPDDIFDPVANIVAGIRYIQSRYGSIGGVPGLVSMAGGGSYVGYDSGGWLQPGITHVYNGTGKPERVISPTGAGPAGSAGGHQINVTVNTNASPYQIAGDIGYILLGQATAG